MVSSINPNFPVSGVDQPSQGFRDNFLAAKTEIEALQTDQSNLQASAMIINSSTIGQLADVDTATNAPSSGNVLSWNGSKWVPSTTSGLTQVSQDPSPKLGGNLDVNGFSLNSGANTLLSFVNISSSVNNLQIQNAQTGLAPVIRVSGSDTNIPMMFETKGTESFIFSNTLENVNLIVPPNTSFTITGSNTGDDLTLNGGDSTTTGGGAAIITGGSTSAVGLFGGDVIVRPGPGATASNGGTIRIQDSANKNLLIMNGQVSGAAVNYFGLINNNTGNSPIFYVNGTDTDVSMSLQTKGNGKVIITGLSFPNVDGTSGQILKTDGAGVLSWINAPTGTMQHVSDDTTPQLGGNLDVNGHQITSTSNGNVVVSPNGTGKVVLSGNAYPTTTGSFGQVLMTDGAGNASWSAPAILTNTATLNFPSISANGGTQDLTIGVSGAGTNDAVIVGLPQAPDAGIIYTAWVSSSNVVTIRATNVSTVPIDPSSAIYRVTVFKY